MFSDKILMITGGTGSFGNKVLSRFLNTDVREIRIFSRDEKKQEEMRLKYNNSKLRFFIGDVRDYASIEQASKGVDYIFHAAALKQVPSCEFYPLEAIKTNTLGAENVMTAAIANAVKKVILLSTDKAVYPINAMGMSKALMEKIMVARSRLQTKNETVFCVTRYGNVMASRGSVIPLFISQIKNEEPITITDPTMTRFLMSLDESVDLVMFAFEHCNQGDIFVQKAAASTIGTLASALKTIFKSNISINTIGTRHGEKLYESLISREEMVRAEDMGRWYKIPSDSRDLNYDKYFNDGEKKISEAEDYTSHNTQRLDKQQTIAVLEKLDYIQNILQAT
jgi:UDP-N-acetylglucosamine 4,6-dehydratase/5-epimerase